MIAAIDPGPLSSAVVVLDDSRVIEHGYTDNDTVVWLLLRAREHKDGKLRDATHLAVEMIASYGMPVGAEVFETCVWIGRFIQAWNGPHELVYRRDVKLHLCGQARAKDGNVRQAIIDRFGGKAKAIGNKKQPGPLYGVSGDIWQALGVALTFADTRMKEAA